jgi:hypothetical protein
MCQENVGKQKYPFVMHKEGGVSSILYSEVINPKGDIADTITGTV